MSQMSRDEVRPFAISSVMICDDHPVSQLGIKCSLQELFPDRNFHFTRLALGQDAVNAVKSQQPDLLILDLHLPDISGIEVLKQLKSRLLNTKIMIMTSEEGIHVLLQLLRYNVGAILLKSYSLAVLETAFRSLEKNESPRTYLDPALERQLMSETENQQLSPREFEVLELLLKGHTNKAIAALMNCSPETVKTHRANIRAKTRLSNRDELSAWFRRGLERDF